VNSSDRPVRNPHVVLREEFDDWAVLFDPDTGKGFGLNPTGVYLARLLDGSHTLDDLLEELGAHARDVPREAPEEITAFLNQLAAEGLAAVHRPEGAPRKERERKERRRARRSPPSSSKSGDPHLCAYAPPELVNLNSEHKALGNCYTGTGICCESGSSTTGCSGGGGGNSNDCGSGNSAHNCSGGSTVGCWNPCTGICCAGLTDAVMCHGGITTSCCNSGNSPSSPITCGYGGSPSSHGSCSTGVGAC